MTASTIPSIGIDFGGTSIKMGVVKGAEVIAHAPSIATQENRGCKRGGNDLFHH